VARAFDYATTYSPEAAAEGEFDATGPFYPERTRIQSSEISPPNAEAFITHGRGWNAVEHPDVFFSDSTFVDVIETLVVAGCTPLMSNVPHQPAAPAVGVEPTRSRKPRYGRLLTILLMPSELVGRALELS
jgi:hypothetical protein